MNENRWSCDPSVSKRTWAQQKKNSGRIHCRPQMQKHWWRWSNSQHIMISNHQRSRRLKRQVSFGWFWRVLDFCRFQISNFREHHSRSKIFGIFSIRCQNICRWGLQSSLKPGNKAFSLPLGWTWSGFPRVFAVVFQWSRMIKLKIKCSEGFHIPNLPFVEAKLPPKTIQTSSTSKNHPTTIPKKPKPITHAYVRHIFQPFSEAGYQPYGLQQVNGGPCGVLAVIQAFVIRALHIRAPSPGALLEAG